VQKNNNDVDSDESDDLPQEDNMYVASQHLEDDTDQVADVHANNEYIEPKVCIPISLRMMIG